MICRCFSVVLALLASTACAQSQDLSVESLRFKTRTVDQVVRTTSIIDRDGRVVSSATFAGDESEPVESEANVIRVVTPAARVTVRASDADRKPVKVQDLANGLYGLAGSRTRVWVDVRVIDFEKQIFEEMVVVVEPVEPPEPPKPIEPIPNEYGVGQLVFDTAPDDQANLIYFADIYAQGKEFLFGRPEYKFLQSTQNNNTEGNLAVWFRNRIQERECRTQEECQQWEAMVTKTNAALKAEQQRRGAFTAADWYAAFSEIQAALEARIK